MSGNEANVVSQREQLVPDRAYQLNEIAIAVFPGSDRAPEQDIADKSHFRRRMKIRHMSFAVTRAMKCLDLDLAKGDAVSVGQPAIRQERLGANAIPPTVFGESVENVLFVAMRALDPCTGPDSKLLGAAAMIEMAMRHQNDFER